MIKITPDCTKLIECDYVLSKELYFLLHTWHRTFNGVMSSSVLKGKRLCQFMTSYFQSDQYYCCWCCCEDWDISTLENTEGTIKNGQSIVTGYIWYTRRRQPKQKFNTIYGSKHKYNVNKTLALIKNNCK